MNAYMRVRQYLHYIYARDPRPGLLWFTVLIMTPQKLEVRHSFPYNRKELLPLQRFTAPTRLPAPYTEQELLASAVAYLADGYKQTRETIESCGWILFCLAVRKSRRRVHSLLHAPDTALVGVGDVYGLTGSGRLHFYNELTDPSASTARKIGAADYAARVRVEVDASADIPALMLRAAAERDAKRVMQ